MDHSASVNKLEHLRNDNKYKKETIKLFPKIYFQ